MLNEQTIREAVEKAKAEGWTFGPTGRRYTDAANKRCCPLGAVALALGIPQNADTKIALRRALNAGDFELSVFAEAFDYGTMWPIPADLEPARDLGLKFRRELL